MADDRELNEEFKQIVDDFRSVIDGILEKIKTRETTTPRGTNDVLESKIKQNQAQQDEVSQRLREYSREVSTTTRVLQTVRQTLGSFNSATLNAISSGISVFQQDLRDIGRGKLRIESSLKKLEGYELQRMRELETLRAKPEYKESIILDEIAQSKLLTDEEIRQLNPGKERGDLTPSELAETQEKAQRNRLTAAGISIPEGVSTTTFLEQQVEQITGKKLSDLTPEELANAQTRMKEALREHEVNLQELTTAYEKETKKRNELEKELGEMGVQLLTDAVNSAAKVLQELVGSIRKTQQQFGITASQAASIKFDDLKTSIDSYISALLPGGKFGAPFSPEQIAAARAAFQTEFGGIISGTSAETIARRAVEEGITAEQQAMARRLFMTMTGERQRAIEAETKFMKQFEDANLTAKDAMQVLMQNSEIFARNGTRFAEQFTRAAAEAKKIGVDLGKIDQVGDNIINNFEGFLESQAELGAMGFGFDTSRLAEIAVTGNTDALMRELQAQLQSTGKNLENLTRPERLALESAFGMSILDIQKLATGEGSGETMEDLQKQNNSILNKLTNVVQSFAVVIGPMAAIGTLLFRRTVTNLMGLILATLTKQAPLNALAAAGLTGSGLAKFGMGAAGVAGLGLSAYGGYQLAKSGNTGAGLLTGIAGGAATGAMLGTVIPGVGTAVGAIGGGIIGALSAGAGAVNAGDDVISKPGYGDRVLVTPTATVALNNEDNIVAYADDMISQEAGLSLLSKGALTPTITPNFSNLEKMLDQKITQMSDRLAQSLPQVRGVYMDGKEVGKVVYNNNDKATSMEVFGISSRATV